MAKYFLSSQTILSAILTGVVSFGALTMGFLSDPSNQKAAVSCANQFGLVAVEDKLVRYVFPGVAVMGSAGAFLGRMRQGNLWTNKRLPGKNKEDFDIKEVGLGDVLSIVQEVKQQIADKDSSDLQKLQAILASLEQKAKVEEPEETIIEGY